MPYFLLYLTCIQVFSLHLYFCGYFMSIINPKHIEEKSFTFQVICVKSALNSTITHILTLKWNFHLIFWSLYLCAFFLHFLRDVSLIHVLLSYFLLPINVFLIISVLRLFLLMCSIYGIANKYRTKLLISQCGKWKMMRVQLIGIGANIFCRN